MCCRHHKQLRLDAQELLATMRFIHFPDQIEPGETKKTKVYRLTFYSTLK